MNNAFFFQTQQIPDDTIFFDELKEQKIFFSYFQVDQKYYLFFYSQKSIDLHFIYQSVDVIQELDSKQRKIRSFRGFFLYALEIMETRENYEILKTNVQPFFWRKVKTIIRQNQKGALLEFLFGKYDNNKSLIEGSSPTFQEMDHKIQNLQNQINSLQQKVIHLETNLENSNYAISDNIDAPDTMKSIQLGDSTSKYKKGLYSAENDPKRSAVFSEIRNPTSQRKEMESKSLLDLLKVDFTQLLNSQEHNLLLNQEKGLNGSNFRTLGEISEEEQIGIIKTGFQRQAEGIISLKNYYEGTGESSLFQLKGYSIKYETIRKNKLYQQLKE